MTNPRQLKDIAASLPEFTALMNAQVRATLPCKGGTEWMAEDQRIQQRAAELCRPCTLLAVCRTYAIAAGERSGVWGGTTAKDRKRLRRKTAA
ncbi:WhiB family transcriptional regulator [Paenarthrobacter sp. CCNWLY172]|uniref:WhiB family transcriptional regulator n=1 Tax=unclassified Paenarthrobacter TaxID=2634190 RepID=UPI003077555E